LVAVTVQDPVDEADRTAPLREHPPDPADVSEKVTEPEPDPPAVDSVRLEPSIVDVETNDSAAWVSFETVTVTGPVVADAYVASAALVAETVHVPADVDDRTAPASEHPALPAEVTE
jgi:hypothetical protein